MTSWRHRALAVLTLASAVGLLLPDAKALDPAQHVTQYSHRAWSIREGFIKGFASGIAQTPDGYLWLGTRFGLVRFDGARAIPWGPPEGPRLPSPVIVSLLAARDGTLWIGTLRGLVSWRSGTGTEYPDFADMSVGVLSEGPDGTIWAAGYSYDSNGPLCAIRVAGIHCDRDSRLGSGAVGVHVDHTGTVWVAAAGGFWRWSPGPPRFYAVAGKNTVAHEFAEEPSGDLLVPLKGRVGRLNAGEIETAYPYPASVGNANGYRILHDRDGSDWIGTLSDGLIRAHAGSSETFTSADGLTGDVVAALFEDHEGNIWVATDKGLDRFSPNPVATYSERDGLATPILSVVAGHDGSIWTTAPGRVYRLHDDELTLYHPPASLPGSRSGAVSRPARAVSVRALPQFEFAGVFPDARGRIWIGSPEIWGYLEQDRFVAVPQIARGTLYATTSDSADNLWIATPEQGLTHLKGDQVEKVLPWSTFADAGVATALAADPKTQVLWIGFVKGGVATLSHGAVERWFKVADGLGAGRVSDLRFDTEGTLWAATDSGVSRLRNGRFDTLDVTNGLPCNRIFWTARSADRSLWLYGVCGLIRVSREQVDAWDVKTSSRVRSTLLDASDGVSLFAGELYQSISPQAAVAPDGGIWFRTLEGLSVIRPRQLPVNAIPPPVQIERIIANGHRYDPRGSLLLPPHIRDLTIEYTALSFVAPEKIHFRYRLQGQDSEWREVVNDRRVQYSNLAPGKYIFRVLANNNSGVWNEQGATLNFAIAPAYWQTLWFWIGCAAAVVFILWMLYQLRLRQIAREFERTLDVRVAERTRIARELHDTLLQSFHGLLFQFQAVSNALKSRPAQARQLLDSAIDQAAAAITQGRDAVQGLRGSIDESNSLATAIGNLVEELSARRQQEPGTVSPPDIRLNFDLATRDLHTLVRDEVYRIAAEALRNAVQHSRGSQITVELHYGRRALRLRVHDDGVGIDTKVVAEGGRPGHFGLRGMRERAELIGAELAVWSAQAIGTEIELTVPASRAYVVT